MIDIGRNVVSQPAISTGLEWLVANGIGGYASGTLSGVLSRRYQGLLVAALNPPTERTTLVSKVDETLIYADQAYPLFSNQWNPDPDSITPQGYTLLNRFFLDVGLPVWEYSIADAILEKRVWMAYGHNTTYVRYMLVRGNLPATLNAKVLVNYKDFHANTQGGAWHMSISAVTHGLRVNAFDGATPFYLLSADAAIDPLHEWYYNYYLNREAYRGLDATGDHLLAGEARFTLQPSESVTLVFSTDPDAPLDSDAAYQAAHQRQIQLIEQAQASSEPDWIQQLVLAADQFIVQRRAGDNPDGRSVIAGYPWFSDWGRDTMISLPGLTLNTGRQAEAALILRTFAHYVDQGMLPNRFPDAGETPEYNTVDATLWYFEAIRAYHAATGDLTIVTDLYPILKDIVAWHERGTRYNIHVDPHDHLLASGQDGVQLTWMDAKVGDWVVTPRAGKAIEINALWYNALRILADFATLCEQPTDAVRYTHEADAVQASFARFWHATSGYCFDVLDAPFGNDPALRPNQLFAVSLHHSPLTAEQQRAVVEVCARHLYTPHGLRSLTPFDPSYVGVYGGDQVQRDGSYHQGTVWAWLIGAFVEAHLRVYNDKALARSYLTPFAYHLHQQGVGSIAEIFDGNAPFTPRGCFAQAWSVAEVLRAWHLTAP